MPTIAAESVLNLLTRCCDTETPLFSAWVDVSDWPAVRGALCARGASWLVLSHRLKGEIFAFTVFSTVKPEADDTHEWTDRCEGMIHMLGAFADALRHRIASSSDLTEQSDREDA